MHCGALTKVLMTLNVILIGLIAVAASTQSQQQCSWSDEECPGESYTSISRLIGIVTVNLVILREAFVPSLRFYSCFDQ